MTTFSSSVFYIENTLTNSAIVVRTIHSFLRDFHSGIVLSCREYLHVQLAVIVVYILFHSYWLVIWYILIHAKCLRDSSQGAEFKNQYLTCRLTFLRPIVLAGYYILCLFLLGNSDSKFDEYDRPPYLFVFFTASSLYSMNKKLYALPWCG